MTNYEIGSPFSFHAGTQPSRHSEATVAVVQRGLASAQAGSRLQHCLHDTEFIDMQEARVVRT